MTVLDAALHSLDIGLVLIPNILWPCGGGGGIV
jgi:hypothetical protein